MSILKTSDKKKSKWKRVAFPVDESKDELTLLNQRLKLFGYETMGQLAKDFMYGKFPRQTEDKQIDNLYQNADKSGSKSLLEGGYNREFYEKANTADMYDYYLNIRKFHKNTCRDLVSYFKRFRDQFFTQRVDKLRSLIP